MTEGVDFPKDNIEDIRERNIQQEIFVSSPLDLKMIRALKKTTPARIAVGRSGPRYKTSTLLRFRADHAAARDSVISKTDQRVIERMNLFSVKTLCRDKEEYLTRPDLGRKFSEETISSIKERCIYQPDVQIVVGDGLSSKAIEANARDVLLSLTAGLKLYEISVGTPFFIKYARVAAMDYISEALQAKVTCILIGERPGLATAQSMSAYLAYEAKLGMVENRRTVVSNIHQDGTPPVEAGAYLVSIIQQMLFQQASGLELQI